MPEDPTRVELFFRRLQNHYLVSGVLIFCGIVIGIAAFTDAVEKLVEFNKKHLSFPSPERDHIKFGASDLQSATPRTAPEIRLGTAQQVQTKRAPELATKIHSESDAKPAALMNQPETSKALPPETREILVPKPKAVPSYPETVPTSNKKSFLEEQMKREISLPKEAALEQDAKPVAPSTTVLSSPETREVVKLATSALKGETMSSRVRGVAALLPSLPNDLNAKEVALLAGDETMSNRVEILALMVTRAKLRSLDPNDIPPILGIETMSSRENCIRIIAPYVRPPITGRQALAILGSETNGNRVACLKPIAPLLQQPLSDSEVVGILRNTFMSNRTEAIRVLFDQTIDIK